MYDGQTVGVVVPAYNEAGHVGGVIETMPAYVDRIYAVDDASSDGTWDEIREHAKRQNGRRRGTGPVRRRVGPAWNRSDTSGTAAPVRR